MELYFIRHGQSENNALYGEQDYDLGSRRSDPRLTDIGFQQAALAADFFARGAAKAPISRKGFQNRAEHGLTHRSDRHGHFPETGNSTLRRAGFT